jgi:probable HAF family extracellular repeat protein
MVDLGTLGGVFSFATAVNARGDVVGESVTADEAAIHATLWHT